MDPGVLTQDIQALMTAKYVLVSAITLTLYDYLLTFNDEIRYVWRGRKTWVAYLYILNRILLIGYQFWEIYYLSSRGESKTVCIAGYYAPAVLLPFFLLSSDIFIMLRIYAITSRNKILAVYFGTLALARSLISLAPALVQRPVFVDLHSLPINTSNLCGITMNLKFMLAPNSIGTVFELSVFLVIARYTYRNKSTLKFSALIRTIAAEATIYFLAMIAMQIYVQLALNLMEGTSQQLSVLAYGLLNPILTMRFAVSLKRSADPDGGQEWQLTHFSTVNFVGDSLPDSEMSDTRGSIEMNIIYLPNDQWRTHKH